MAKLTSTANRRYPGLQDPAFEHANCGVGAIADLKGRRTHGLVSDALTILENLAHRGAKNADPLTGDGSGILLPIADEFFRPSAAASGINLPPAGRYGVGAVFLPAGGGQAQACRDLIAAVAAERGQKVLGWRNVPIRRGHLGRLARARLPRIEQVFIALPAAQLADAETAERQLFITRKLVEARAAGLGLTDPEAFFVCSLSVLTTVYKGMLISTQTRRFFPDLDDPRMLAQFAIVHSRFSTNTLGSWRLAHPYRMTVHNGEINTFRGNANWMAAREAVLDHPDYRDLGEQLFPIITPNSSDTAAFDNVVELLVRSGRPLAQAMLMMVPEAWERHSAISPRMRDFYRYHACLMEPWDGPALLVTTDGRRIAALLDRNGFRPFRYTETWDGRLVLASETGVLDLDIANVRSRGRLAPGQILLIDPDGEGIVNDRAVKDELADANPYGSWLEANLVAAGDLPAAPAGAGAPTGDLRRRQRAFGYTFEDLATILQPMGLTGAEPIGSMGLDTPLAVFSEQPQPLFNYFKQLFAQVSNPPVDAIREELVTAIDTLLGAHGNILADGPEQARLLHLDSVVAADETVARIAALDRPGLRARTLDTLYGPADSEGSLTGAMDDLCARVDAALADGCTILVLSDRGADAARAPIPALLAVAGVHHHLIRTGQRLACGLISDTGEALDVHAVACLLGYGAQAVCPYLAFESIRALSAAGELNSHSADDACAKYVKALEKGVLKIMSKMGISTARSYQGAQIFEAVGLSQELVDRHFTWTPTRIGGITIDELQRDYARRQLAAYPQNGALAGSLELEPGGYFQWYRDGERHMLNPATVALLQKATGANSYPIYREFAAQCEIEDRRATTLRGLLEFRRAEEPLPLDAVEPEEQIVQRFATGAISLGAISKEAHEALAVAMNSIGAKSNTGEGGEDHRRYKPDPDGSWRNSSIKQVASGRFGVTTEYLVNATDLQIKMAQGSKPGEGGQLPGRKVDEYIGWIRHSTPGVELISPPPHHDIYSIEDLAQLIHDLKNVNPASRINVKLVAAVGVGTIAAGVAKGFGDVVLISGDSGGTGASPWSSIKHAGLPWELGLAETHQVLLENDLRSRIVVQTDGQLRTGRDVAIACLLGAEEFGFSTLPLVTLGCIMLRKCHLNTCSVGVATQDPVLRARFAGRPEAVVNYFFMVARHMREIMAALGIRKVDEMIGRADLLVPREEVGLSKTVQVDLSRLLYRPQVGDDVGHHRMFAQQHGLNHALDNEIIRTAAPALEERRPVRARFAVRNSNRTLLTMLSGEIARRHGGEGLPADTIRLELSGSCGQSFGAFLAPGIDARIVGDANDYFGKGMAGGTITIRPPPNAGFSPEENIIVGNVVLYGATGGKMFVRGQAGERFAVRNSGAAAVVEGVGDHGCEYMTGGVVVVIGPTGRNFAAGMSGGVAYVLDPAGHLANGRCNPEMVELESPDGDDLEAIRALLEEHLERTGSQPARELLAEFDQLGAGFVKVMPRDYKRVLAERAARTEAEELAAMELVHHG